MSEKPVLGINQYNLDHGPALGCSYLLRQLIKSNLFDIYYHNDVVGNKNASKAHLSSIIYYNGFKVLLDLWEFPTPTHTSHIIEDNSIKLIIKLQHRWHTYSAERYVRWCRSRNFCDHISDERLFYFWRRIVPWTFFPSPLFEKDIEEGIEYETNIDDNNVCFFYGRPWACRQMWFGWLEKQNIEYNTSWKQNFVTPKNFKDLMLTCRYGLVINGKGHFLTDCKNRRTVEYMYLRKPLLLTHRPLYYNKMIPGYHYIPLTLNTDVKNIEDEYNVKEIAEHGREYFDDNFSSKGVATTFLQILKREII